MLKFPNFVIALVKMDKEALTALFKQMREDLNEDFRAQLKSTNEKLDDLLAEKVPKIESEIKKSKVLYVAFLMKTLTM